MKRVSILGVTGSVGAAAVDVITKHSPLFSVVLVSANQNVDALAAQAIALKASHAVIADESRYDDLRAALQDYPEITVHAGRKALIALAGREVDVTISAIVGMAGLEPLMAAIAGSQAVAIANKEPLVAAGDVVMRAARESGTTLLPLDSEHNAVFQVFDPAQKGEIEQIVLTASGGPFRDSSLDEMAVATPAQALAHPNWSMGQKISIDSATMMNKALEVIEAHYLFDLPPEKIEVLVNPQSIMHAMVAYCDGSVLTQMGAPDMRTPMSYVLGYPDRIETAGETLDLKGLNRLDFSPVDARCFPAVGLAYECLKKGQGACLALNAANEVAVDAFLSGEIGFLDIVAVIRHCLDTMDAQDCSDIADIETVIKMDEEIRQMTRDEIDKKQTKDRIQRA